MFRNGWLVAINGHQDNPQSKVGALHQYQPTLLLVGYHLELRIAIALLWHIIMSQAIYIVSCLLMCILH